MKKSPLTVALTGGIGSGKSTVSSLLRSLGVPVIDLDAVCHHLLGDRAGKVFHDVVARFGKDILDEAGCINRTRLAAQVFTEDHKARHDLESILHPAAHKVVTTISSSMTAPYHVVCIPLLAESDTCYSYDKVLVVSCPVKQRVERVIRRGGLTGEQIDKIIEAQASEDDRLALADDEVDNSGDAESLREQLINLHERYSMWATGRTRSS